MRRMSCDVFDIQETKYYPSKYKFPYKLSNMDKVSTDEEEAFALIITGYGIVVFTEEDGFHELPNHKIEYHLTRNSKTGIFDVFQNAITKQKNACLLRL